MTTRFDAIVIGGGTNGLVAAIRLARAGFGVALLEREAELGGIAREIEFAPGFKAAPFGADGGWIPPAVARGIGLDSIATATADPTVVSPLGDGGWLELRRDAGATAAGLRRFAPADADRWPAFCARLHRIAGFLAHLYLRPPPDIEGTSPGELWDLLRVGRKLRGLGRTDMVEVLRTVPLSAAELLDEWFRHDGLKGTIAAEAVTDLCQGPMSGGTAFNLLHRHVGGAAGGFRARTAPRGGPGALIRALADLARRAGVDLRTGAGVARILVGGDDRVAGVRLDSGEELSARSVLSTADPRRTLLELLDPVHLDPELMLAVRNIRFRGAQAKILLALDGVPDAPGLPADGFRAAISISPSITFLERAYDATKYGRFSEDPYLEARLPSLAQPELAPPRKQVMVIHLQYAPHRLGSTEWSQSRDRLADAAISGLERYLPGLGRRILHRTVLTPPDLEARFGLFEGAVTQGEMMLDQILFMRPVPGYSRYAMPVAGLYLAGAGAHPGPGVIGGPGWLAARAVIGAGR